MFGWTYDHDDKLKKIGTNLTFRFRNQRTIFRPVLFVKMHVCTKNKGNVYRFFEWTKRYTKLANYRFTRTDSLEFRYFSVPFSKAQKRFKCLKRDKNVQFQPALFSWHFSSLINWYPGDGFKLRWALVLFFFFKWPMLIIIPWCEARNGRHLHSFLQRLFFYWSWWLQLILGSRNIEPAKHT